MVKLAFGFFICTMGITLVLTSYGYLMMEEDNKCKVLKIVRGIQQILINTSGHYYYYCIISGDGVNR